MAKKKLTAADEKFVKDFLNGDKLDFSADKKIIRRNRFSGEEVEVCPITAAAVDFVFNVESAFNREAALKRICSLLTVGNALQKFDRARYLVAKLNSSAYMTLLD